MLRTAIAKHPNSEINSQLKTMKDLAKNVQIHVDVVNAKQLICDVNEIINALNDETRIV